MCRLTPVLVLALGLCTAAQAVDGALFWTNRGLVQTSNLDGTEVRDLVASGINTAADIELDLGAGMMYWTDLGNRTVKRANLDGSGVETLIPIGQLDSVLGLELELTGGNMYMADQDGIHRANLDGSGLETIIEGSAYHIELDLANRLLYWTTGYNGEVRRAGLDGGDVELIATCEDWANGIALDIAGDRLYWTDGGTGSLWASRPDGSDAALLLQFDHTVRPLDIELDLLGEHVYIADNSRTRIWRTGLDGSSPVPVIDLADPPPSNLLGIAVSPVPEPATLGLLALGGLAALRRKQGG